MNQFIEDCNSIFNHFNDLFFSNDSNIKEIDDYYYNYENNKELAKINFLNYMRNKYNNDANFKNRYERYGKSELEDLIKSSNIKIIPERDRSDLEYYLYRKIKILEKMMLIMIIMIIIIMIIIMI